MEAIDGLLRRYESTLLPPTPDESRLYGWEPLPLREFINGMDVARQHLIDRNKCWTGNERFLDAGSGIGTKLFLAQAFGWQVVGIERHVPYIEVSRRMFPELFVAGGDAFEYPDYSDFDLVYTYRLCVNDDEQRQLIAHIVQQMHKGALLFSARWDPVGLAPLGSQVWVI